MILISRNNVEPDDVLIGAMASAIANSFVRDIQPNISAFARGVLSKIIEREFHKRFEITHRTKSV